MSEYEPGDNVHYFAHGTRTVLRGFHESLGEVGYVISDPHARGGRRWVAARELSLERCEDE